MLYDAGLFGHSSFNIHGVQQMPIISMQKGPSSVQNSILFATEVYICTLDTAQPQFLTFFRRFSQ